MYQKQTWANGDPSRPLSAARLNHLETQAEAAVEEIERQISLPGAPIKQALDATIGGVTKPLYGLPLTIEQFAEPGAQSDDDALAAAIAAGENRAISLQPGKVYRLTRTAVVDLAKVRGFMGNHAQIEVTGNFPALRLVGSHGGSANPATTSKEIRAKEFVPAVSNLHIAGVAADGSQVGVGIEIEGTFGLQISGCYIRDVATGIKVVGNNRNLKLVSNEIWNVLDYGVWFSGGEIHQVTFTGNGISYARKIIYFDGTRVYNAQFTGNDLELSTTPALRENVFMFRDGYAEDISIVGNTIEDHSVASDALIAFTNSGTTRTATLVRIVGNNLSNFRNGAIRLETFHNFVISSNNVRADTGGGYLVKASLKPGVQSSLLTVVDNVLFNMEVGGIIDLYSDTSGLFGEGVRVAGNQALGVGAVPILVRNVSLSSSSFDDNTIDLGSNTGARYPALPDAGLIDMAVNYLRNVTVRGNKLRARGKAKHAIRVTGALGDNKTRFNVSDNLATEVTDTALPFSVGTVGVNRDNIHAV